MAWIAAGSSPLRRYAATASGSKKSASKVRVVGVRVGSDEALGQRRGPGEEEPVPVADAELAVRARDRLAGRDDVDDREPLDALGVVERHAVADPRATVVAADGESLEAERAHERDLVARHR